MDAVDRTLVEALRANGRATYAELARLVGLSGPSVTDRINRLEQAGVITGYRAAVDPSTLGLGVTALIGVLLSDAADLDDVARRLKDVPEIEDCWFVAGEESFVLKVRVADPGRPREDHREAGADPGCRSHSDDDRAVDQVGSPADSDPGGGLNRAPGVRWSR